MSVDAKDIQITPEMAKAIADSMNPSDIRTAVQAELEKQAQALAATAASDAAAAAEAKTAADAAAIAAGKGAFSRVENIGGKDFTFEGENEAEVNQMVLNAYRVAYALQPTEAAAAVVAEPVAPTQAEIEAAQAKVIADRAELDLRFKRGELSTTDYLEQSGAVAEYLAKQGVPIEALKASLEQTQSNTFTQSWADATQEFLNGPAGSDWPGGAKNLEIIGMKLSSMGLVDAQDKVAALAQAYSALKASGTLFPYEPPAGAAPAAAAPAAAAVPAVAAAPAAAAAPPAAAVPAKTAATSSSLFGVSSGTGGEGVSAPAPKGDVKIDPNATPAEIIEAWKAQNLAAGKNPNQAFNETFGTRRA